MWGFIRKENNPPLIHVFLKKKERLNHINIADYNGSVMLFFIHPYIVRLDNIE